MGKKYFGCEIMINKSTVHDVENIKALIGPYVKEGLILPKSLYSLYTSIRDFWITYDDKDDKTLKGCCALQVSWEDLGEIRTLAVSRQYHGLGIGSSLVNACMDEARMLGLRRLFTLTYAPDFFKKIGFGEVDKMSLPNKIWADCIHCPYFPDCRETALVYDLGD